MRMLFRVLRSTAAAMVLICAMASDAGAACTVTTSGVTFGTYDVFSGSPLDSTGSVTIGCDSNNNDVAIIMSTGGSGTYFPRRMGGPGGDNLDYNLYTDASRSTVWGNSTGGTGYVFQADVDKNETFTFTIYGRVSAGQDVSGGSYADSVTVTIVY